MQEELDDDASIELREEPKVKRFRLFQNLFSSKTSQKLDDVNNETIETKVINEEDTVAIETTSEPPSRNFFHKFKFSSPFAKPTVIEVEKADEKRVHFVSSALVKSEDELPPAPPPTSILKKMFKVK